MLPDKVTIHFYVICPFLKHRIIGNLDGTSVISKERLRSEREDSKVE